MRSSELALLEAARPAAAPKPKRRPLPRAEALHREVLGEFARLGVVDHEDALSRARGERRAQG